MSSVDDAIQTQLRNIQTRTGQSLDELSAFISKSGLAKHGEIRDLLKRDLGLGHGDANSLAHYFLKSGGRATPGGAAAAPDDAASALYSGAKTSLRPIHDKLMAAVAGFGPFEIAPKKGYLSLRRKKQFAMIGPPTNTRVEVGLNVKGLPPAPRLIEVPAGGMCQYKVHVTSVGDADEQVTGWLKQAYESAG
jgi:hypothetical protein